MNRSVHGIVVAATFVLALAASGAEPAKAPKTTSGNQQPGTALVFYEIPGCPICKKINGWLDTLDKEHPNKAQIIRKPSSEALHEEMVARGIDHHGVVILTPAGEVSWRNDAHTLTEQALRQGFTKFVLEASSTPSHPTPTAQPAPKSNDTVLTVDVTGMDCDGCAKKINDALTKLDGVTKCEIT